MTHSPLASGQVWQGEYGRQRRIVNIEYQGTRIYVEWEPVNFIPSAQQKYRLMLVSSFRVWCLKKITDNATFSMIS